MNWECTLAVSLSLNWCVLILLLCRFGLRSHLCLPLFAVLVSLFICYFNLRRPRITSNHTSIRHTSHRRHHTDVVVFVVFIYLSLSLSSSPCLSFDSFLPLCKSVNSAVCILNRLLSFSPYFYFGALLLSFFALSSLFFAFFKGKRASSLSLFGCQFITACVAYMCIVHKVLLHCAWEKKVS